MLNLRKHMIYCLMLLGATLFGQAVFAESSFLKHKYIGVLVYDGVLSSDVTAPLEVFGVASNQAWFGKLKVVTISVEDKSEIKTEEGIRLGVDYWIGNAPKLEALVVTSSYKMQSLLDNDALISFIKTTGDNDAWLQSNCSGALLLAEAGVLDGLDATTYSGGERKFQKLYPEVNVLNDKNLVVDGKIITSNGSLVSYQAALKLLHLMKGKAQADEVASAIQYERFSTKAY